MTFNVTQGTGLLENSMNKVQLLGTEWILGLLLTFIILLLITRNVEKWTEWAFPISLMLLLLGIKIHLLQTITTALIFGMMIMNKNTLGNFIDSLPTRINKKEKDIRKKDIRKEFRKRQLKSIKSLGTLSLAQELGKVKKEKRP